MAFIDGVYPAEAPYFFWGSGIPLSSHKRDIPDRQKRGELIESIIDELTTVRSRNRTADGVLTYLSEALCRNSLIKIQALAVEALLALELYVKELAAGRLPEAIPHLSAAYEAIIEATCQAWDEFGNARLRARKGGLRRHQKDPKQKAKKLVFQRYRHWREDPKLFKSKAAFARAMLDEHGQLESQKKIEDWVREWDREREIGTLPAG
ncbi:hypothetical protein [Solimonas soli]|uniref:hypothetical protein n=1 Tax=Solimonas soli TaxID=413479 RepID=UPI000483AE33|nr:hypothetical protein [Solimonas soli]